MKNRRDFIRSTASLALLPLLPLKSASALTARAIFDPANGHFFVMVRILLGMDVTLGLDPWTNPTLPDPNDMFVEYKPDGPEGDDGLTVINPQMKLGPSAQPLKVHANDFSIINGVFMSQTDNGHPAAERYITAGTTAADAPSLPIEIAKATAIGDFGALANTSPDMGTRAVPVTFLNDLRNLPLQPDMSPLFKLLFGVDLGTSYYKSVQQVIGAQASVKAFLSNAGAMGNIAQLSEQQILAAAFLANAASSAQFDTPFFNLDTHANHPVVHKSEQKKAWSLVSDLFTLFKNTPYGGSGDSLFDRTTFMVVSDFSRTPALNSAQGKDHNPMTNSILLAGRGVVGGVVVGGSRLITRAMSPTAMPYHIAAPIDYATFAVQMERTSAAKMIFPENVAQTVAQIVSARSDDFQSVTKGTLALKPLIK